MKVRKYPFNKLCIECENYEMIIVLADIFTGLYLSKSLCCTCSIKYKGKVKETPFSQWVRLVNTKSLKVEYK